MEAAMTKKRQVATRAPKKRSVTNTLRRSRAAVTKARAITDEFSTAHNEGMRALNENDLSALDGAITREAALIDQFSTAVKSAMFTRKRR
jgi:hypothetical protein